ncbi:MAG: hypothetical protein VX615_05335 [Planctomycetota bacterium]|nr:hypothetical protein [Planctomycetota bacterium]
MSTERFAILVALALSIVIHIVLVPNISPNRFQANGSEQTKSTHLETPDRDDEVRIGIDESKTSTLTWIGYEEYELHRAQVSTVEQAATTTSKPKPTPAVLGMLRELQKPASKIIEQLLQAIGELHIAIPTRSMPLIDSQVVEVAEKNVHEVTVEDNNEDAVESDSDSIPTSIIKVSKDMWKSGKPLAGEGVVLKPRKPSFTSQQMVSNSPSDLLVELHIDSDGKPSDVVLLIGTGSYSIDRTLISSLYRWRASGEHIEAMKEGEVFKIVVHLTFAK